MVLTEHKWSRYLFRDRVESDDFRITQSDSLTQVLNDKLSQCLVKSSGAQN